MFGPRLMLMENRDKERNPSTSMCPITLTPSRQRSQMAHSITVAQSDVARQRHPPPLCDRTNGGRRPASAGLFRPTRYTRPTAFGPSPPEPGAVLAAVKSLPRPSSRGRAGYAGSCATLDRRSARRPAQPQARTRKRAPPNQETGCFLGVPAKMPARNTDRSRAATVPTAARWVRAFAGMTVREKP
jgi:hypothetical protein